MATIASPMVVAESRLPASKNRVPAASNPAATRVLLVEDNAADRNLLRLSLQGLPENYKLETAETLAEGLKKLASHQADIALLDLSLPDSEGKETVEKVLHQAPHVPILVLTGADDDRAALEAVRAGAQDYIVKGQIDGPALSRAMRHAIKRHQYLTALRETREKQLEFKDRFLSHVSHELRSPLACIHQYAEVMLDGLAGPLTDKEREYLGNVLRNAKQLNGLVNDLLDGAQANVGKLTVELTRVQPALVVKELLQTFEAKAKARGIVLGAEMSFNLPPILADRDRLLQVVANLIENAFKFTDEGGEIMLRAGVFAEDPDFVVFSVSDTGKGIYPENLSRIFDRLFQEQNAVSNGRGLGLGLAISKELVEQHGGRLWVESTLGVGSVFSFIVPRFSLATIIAPLLVHQGRLHEATLVVVEIARQSESVSREAWEFGRRRCREVVERCILPDKDLLLPAMCSTEDRDLIFILACADAVGTGVLEKRLRGQVAAASQVAHACVYRGHCVPLPQLPAGILQPHQQLEWISEKIELAVLQVGRN